jgi:hypothetical protein
MNRELHEQLVSWLADDIRDYENLGDKLLAQQAQKENQQNDKIRERERVFSTEDEY